MGHEYTLRCSLLQHASCKERIVRQSAHPHPESRPAAADEGAPAARALLEVCRPQHPRELGASQRGAEVEWGALPIEVACVGDEREGGRREGREDGPRL